MSISLPQFHLQIHHSTIPQFQISHPKTKASASNLKQTHGRKIKRNPSKVSTNSVSRRRFKESVRLCNVSLIKKLTSLLSMGCLEDALQMFDIMDKSSTFVWNLIIRGLTDSGLFTEAVEVYCRMLIEGITEDNFTFPFVIKACAAVFGLRDGRKVHSRIVKLGFDSDIYVCNALITMYAKVWSIQDSERVFDRMTVRDVVSWNSMISGYVSSGDGWSSLMCFRRMQVFGVLPDRFSVVSVLRACSLELSLLSGKEVFCHVLRHGLEYDSMIQSSLVDMFGKCGEVNYAESFCNRIPHKNVVVWNALIGAYAFNGDSLKAFSCLRKMQDDDNVRPDDITLINLLPCCSRPRAKLAGKAIHCRAIRNGFLPNIILESALIDMYGKCGSLSSAEYTFLQMKEKNLISWNAMISAYLQNSCSREAIVTYQKLQNGACVPDDFTFVSVLPAYAEIALPKEGKQIHGHIYKLGISSSTFISNSLVHMYAKCGDVQSARKVFDTMPFKVVVSWNTMIMAYGIHGFGEYSGGLFTEMINEGNKPNESTFVSLLTSCSISGTTDEGWRHFNSMKKYFGLDPGIEHYGCMLDLLGREGNLNRAKRFIEEMPLEPTSRIWGSLLGASRHHRNIELAEMAADQIFSLDNNNLGCYVLLSNLYAGVGRWDDVERIRGLMKKQGLAKTTGCSIVQCNSVTHKFTNYDRSHIESNTIFDVLNILLRKIRDHHHVSSISTFKPQVLLKRRANSPVYHSVRLAVCFGLISTEVRCPVLIRKNTRICEDCHIAIKKISQVSDREIVVGDSKIYHHFKDGRCSCGDYW